MTSKALHISNTSPCNDSNGETRSKQALRWNSMDTLLGWKNSIISSMIEQICDVI